MSNSPFADAIQSALLPIANPQSNADGTPHATHYGEFDIVPGVRLKCYRLSDGKTVIAEESMQEFFRWLSGVDESAAGQD